MDPLAQLKQQDVEDSVAAALHWRDRIWWRLGFRPGRLSPPERWDLTAREEGWAPGYAMLELTIDLTWRDRLRALVSGRLLCSNLIRTDVMVRKMEAVSVTTVMPPGARVRSGL